MVKNLPAMQETWVLSLNQEDPLEKGQATHSKPGESHGQSSLVEPLTPSLFICKYSICMRVCDACSVVSDSLRPHGLQLIRFLCPWDFPGKNTGVGYHFLLQGIFLIQGLNSRFLHLLYWQAGSLPTGPPGNTSYKQSTRCY